MSRMHMENINTTTFSPDNVDLRKVMLDVEELILALSSSTSCKRVCVAHKLMCHFTNA